MKLACLISGGKDSLYAAWLAKKQGHEITCFISIESENENSYMFHTPSIFRVKNQAKTAKIPLIIQKTKGKKESELNDLEKAIKKAKEKHKIEGIVTGAIESVYQTSRVEKITNKLKIECFNPLWQKNEIKYLKELIKNDFEVMITAVAAWPLDKTWLGRKIDKTFIQEVKKLKERYKIHPAGEGGEFETFVLDCPLFKKSLEVKSFKDISTGKNSWRREVEVE